MKHAIKLAAILLFVVIHNWPLHAQWDWEFLGKPLNDTTVEGILVDPADEMVWYVTSIQSGLYITRDAGTTWSHPLATAGLNIEGFQIDPVNPARLFAGIGKNLHFSEDKGKTWKVISTLPESIRSMLISKRDGSVFVAPQTGENNKPGIYKSEDGGKHFNLLPFGVTTNHIICWDIEEDDSTGALYVAIELADHPAPYDPPFFRSLDGGKHWDETSGILPWHGLKLQIDPNDHSVYYLLERGGLYKSTDQAGTWQLANQVYGFYMVLDPINSERIWVGDDIRFDDGGAYFSANSGHSFIPIGPANVSASYLALNQNSTVLYVASYGNGLWRTMIPNLDAEELLVTTTADSGPNSLRDALNLANIQATGSTIHFAIPTTDPGFDPNQGTWTIQLLNPLPVLNVDGITIDGASQAVYTGMDNNPEGPEIVLNGSRISTLGISALEIHSASNTINQLNIQDFSGPGILIRGEEARFNQISGNYIGTDATGLLAKPTLTAIYIEDAPLNEIGTEGDQFDNLLSGNSANGIYIIGQSAYGNRITNNYIGVSASGEEALPNQAMGISTLEAPRTHIGSGQVKGGNVISGNLNDGIRIYSDSNYIQGNRIGLGAGGDHIIGNKWNGIAVYGSDNLIGGSDSGTANVLSGNGNYGVNLVIDAQRNQVMGNLIGTDVTGELGRGNEYAGIALIYGPKYNTIGPDNRIAYNPYGITCIADTSLYNTFTHNIIYANTQLGISLQDGANGNIARPEIDAESTNKYQGTSVANATIEVFSDEAGQGRQYEGTTSSDGDGHFEWQGSPAGPFLTVTATDQDGNTSIFSKPFQVSTVAVKPVNDPAQTSILIHPNPVNNEMRVQIPMDQAGHLKVDVVSMRGELLRVLDDQFYSAGLHALHYPVNELPSGIYVLQIRVNQKSYVRRLCVVH